MRFANVFACILVSVSLMSCAYSQKKSRKFLQGSWDRQYDLVIVPGVPLENGKWSNTMKARLYWAKYLFNKGIAKNLMFSGGAVYTPYVEAKVMALYAEKLGIPVAHIFLETNAEHSVENVYYSVKKGQILGFKSFAVASDPFQTKLLSKFIKKRINPNTALLPIVFDSLKTVELPIDPEINYKEAYVERFVPITERETFRQRLRATRGKRLDTAGYRK